MSDTYHPPTVESSPSSLSARSSPPDHNSPSSTAVSSSSTRAAPTPSSSSTLVPTPSAVIGGVALPSLDELPRPAPRDFSGLLAGGRRPPTGFGDRLANARNLRPNDAPAPFPTRSSSSTYPYADRDALFPTWGSNAYIEGEPLPGGYKKYAAIPGSYNSPYDSYGVTPGDRHLPSETTTMEEFEAKYGAAAVRAKAEKAAAAEASVKSKSEPPVAPFPAALEHKSVVPELPQGTSDRFLFLGPFKLIREYAALKGKHDPVMKQLDVWLSAYMHENLHEVHLRCSMLPSVAYSVKIPITDEHWLNYNQALAHFMLARDMHNSLSLGKDGFDQVTATHRAEGLEGEEGALTWPLLTEPDLTLEQTCALLVKRNRLSVPWDYARMHYHPEIVPEELGGRLKGYPIHVTGL